MGNKSIQERIEKLKALQIVQRNLSTDDANYAAKLATVNKEMASLKKQMLMLSLPVFSFKR